MTHAFRATSVALLLLAIAAVGLAITPRAADAQIAAPAAIECGFDGEFLFWNWNTVNIDRADYHIRRVNPNGSTSWVAVVKADSLYQVADPNADYVIRTRSNGVRTDTPCTPNQVMPCRMMADGSKLVWSESINAGQTATITTIGETLIGTTTDNEFSLAGLNPEISYALNLFSPCEVWGRSTRGVLRGVGAGWCKVTHQGDGSEIEWGYLQSVDGYHVRQITNPRPNLESNWVASFDDTVKAYTVDTQWVPYVVRYRLRLPDGSSRIIDEVCGLNF